MSAKGMGIPTVRNGGPPKRLNKGASTKISWSEARVINQNLKETSISGYEGTEKKTCHFGGGINREARDGTRGKEEYPRKNKDKTRQASS